MRAARQFFVLEISDPQLVAVGAMNWLSMSSVQKGKLQLTHPFKPTSVYDPRADRERNWRSHLSFSSIIILTWTKLILLWSLIKIKLLLNPATREVSSAVICKYGFRRYWLRTTNYTSSPLQIFHFISFIIDTINQCFTPFIQRPRARDMILPDKTKS